MLFIMSDKMSATDLTDYRTIEPCADVILSAAAAGRLWSGRHQLVIGGDGVHRRDSMGFYYWWL